MSDQQNYIQQPLNQPPSLPPVGNLLKRTWQIYKERIKVFLGIAIIPVLVSIPLIIILVAGTFLLSKNIWFFASFLAFYIPVMVILQLWAMLALLYAIKERGVNIGIKDSFRISWHKILPYLWISIISSFLIIGGFLLFVIPGIIFSIWFSLAVYILISEDLRGMNALFRSKQLVKGYWWNVFGRFIVINLIIMMISLSVSVLFGTVSMFLGISKSSISPFFNEIPRLIISFFFLPFSVTFSYLIYEDLKKLKKDVPFVAPERKTKIKYILIGIAGLVILGFGIWFSIRAWKFSLPIQAGVRDVRREMDKVLIQEKLKLYYSQSNTFPENLDELSPNFWTTAPKDPKTNLPYGYKVLTEGRGTVHYELCIDFELKEEGCLYVYSSVKQKAPTDETTNWETYRNEEYGFEVKHPKEWEINSSDPLSVYWVDPKEKVHYESPYVMPLKIDIKDRRNKTLAEWTSGSAEEREDFPYTKLKDITVEGIKTVMLDDPVTMGGPWKVVFIPKNDVMYKIGTSLTKTKFDQILSTFKFIE